jgi:hypothetical protein
MNFNMNLKNRNSVVRKERLNEEETRTGTEQKPSHLQHFRQNLHKDPLYHKPYTDHKHGIYLYQILFVLIGTILSLLGFTMIFQTPNWMSEYFFVSSNLAKNAVVVFALSLGLAAYAIASSMKTEKEVAKHMEKKAKNKLQRIYRRKYAEFSYGQFADSSHSSWLDLCLRNAMDRIDHAYEENLQLFRQIHRKREIDAVMKEKLLNQALVELKTEFERITRDFLHQPVAGHLGLRSS